MTPKKLIYSFLILAIFIVFFSTNAWALYVQTIMTLEGSNQGLIKGDGYRISDSHSGHFFPDVIFVASFGHSLIVPTDPQSGQTTGEKVHSPFRVVKPVDRATPLLFQALVMGENITNVTIEFYRHEWDGYTRKFFTIILEDAKIISIAPSLISSIAEGVQITQMMEIVSFGYKKIKWIHIDGTESEDYWVAPPL